MVAFVDTRNMARWVADTGVEVIVAGMAEQIRRDFLRWPEFDLTPRIASHSTDGVIELMPTADRATYSFKYVNGHPSNPANGFQTVTAFGVLADVATGYPTFWSEMTILTALRTAATSALVARTLARPDSRVMALIGAGAQAEFQTLAFRALLGIEQIRVWDTDPLAVEKYRANLAGTGIDIVVATSARAAVAGADIITTCTADKTNATILTADMVLPGVHVNAIGGDCPGKTELDADILRGATVFVEFTEQTRIEGELQQLPDTFAVTEIWEVLAGLKAGRTSAEQVTVFDSVGFAIEDFSALCYLRDSLQGSDYAVDLELIADPADPKDLFSLVRRTTVSA